MFPKINKLLEPQAICGYFAPKRKRNFIAFYSFFCALIETKCQAKIVQKNIFFACFNKIVMI